MKKQKSMIAYTGAYGYFAEKLKSHSEAGFVDIYRKTFKDGETYHRILSDCKGQDIILVGGMHNDKETMELFDLGCGLVREKIRSLTIVVPYFGYSTMERQEQPGEIVKAKNRAHLISSIPRAMIGHSVYLVDLHLANMTEYFPTEMHPTHIQLFDLVIEQTRTLRGNIPLKNTMIGSADAGRIKYVEFLADRIGTEAVVVYKQRISETERKIIGINANVKGKTIFLYDDMIRTGSSLLKAAREYKRKGAEAVHAISTHAVFTEKNPRVVIKKLIACPAIDSLSVTDTHPHGLLFRELGSPKLHLMEASKYVGSCI